MSDTKERAGAAGVVVAGVFFKIALKGQYLKSVVITPTMGPGVKINPMKLA